jgi:hypothetical protein
MTANFFQCEIFPEAGSLLARCAARNNAGRRSTFHIPRVSRLAGPGHYGGSQVLPNALEHRVPDLAFGGLGPVFDLRKQRWLNPYAPVRNLLAVRLFFANQRLEPRLQVFGRHLVKAVVDLAGINQVVALEPSDVQPVEFVRLEGKACDR